MAAGCTVVLKPSEIAPLDAFILAEVIDDVGLPAGVFNLVTGTGAEVGEAISEHPRSTWCPSPAPPAPARRVGRGRVGDASSASPSSSAASPPTSCSTTSTTTASRGAVRDGVGKAYLNSGQTCTALTRMLVPAGTPGRRRAHRGRRGRDQVPAAGPLRRLRHARPAVVSQAQVDRVTSYIQKGIDEGAKLVTGGTGKPEGLRGRLLREAHRLLRTCATT